MLRTYFKIFILLLIYSISFGQSITKLGIKNVDGSSSIEDGDSVEVHIAYTGYTVTTGPLKLLDVIGMYVFFLTKVLVLNLD